MTIQDLLTISWQVRSPGSGLLPCQHEDPRLWFAERPADLERAKAFCQPCPVRALCLAGAAERQEPHGVWGGEIFEQGIGHRDEKTPGAPAQEVRAAPVRRGRALRSSVTGPVAGRGFRRETAGTKVALRTDEKRIAPPVAGAGHARSSPMAETAGAHPGGSSSERDALLRTKLHVPRAQPGLVARPRLAGRLDEGLDHGLVLIAAPAGYGKSVLLSQWARAQAQPVAWLSLDGRDNDPVRFWRHVLAALDMVRPGVAERVGPLAGPPPPSAYNPLVTALINDVVAEPGPPDVAARARRLSPDQFGQPCTRRSGSCSSTGRPSCGSCWPAGPIRRLAWPGTGPGASWGRCAPTTSGSPPEEAAELLGQVSADVDASSAAALAERTEGWAAGCSWRPCRCAASPTSPASWPRSPAVTGTSSTT